MNKNKELNKVETEIIDIDVIENNLPKFIKQSQDKTEQLQETIIEEKSSPNLNYTDKKNTGVLISESLKKYKLGLDPGLNIQTITTVAGEKQNKFFKNSLKETPDQEIIKFQEQQIKGREDNNIKQGKGFFNLLRGSRLSPKKTTEIAKKNN
jgi:hypothetical protein